MLTVPSETAVALRWQSPSGATSKARHPPAEEASQVRWAFSRQESTLPAGPAAGDLATPGPSGSAGWLDLHFPHVRLLQFS